MSTRSSRYRPGLTGAMVLLLACALPAVAAAPVAADSPPVALYLGDRFNYIPIDPLTLEDRTDLPAVEVVDPIEARGFVTLSADGSTWVSLMAGEVVVRDGLGGAERSRFVVGGSGGLFAVSADGTRIVVSISVDYSDLNLHRPAWKVFDTRTGELISAIEGEESIEVQTAVDPAADRLYRLVAVGGSPDVTERTGPRPARLIAHDMTTGEETDRLDLPDMRVGSWATDEMLGDEDAGTTYPLMRHLSPGVAVSPDGDRLAIVHAASETMTLVATPSLTVERTVPLTTPRSWGSRFLGWLPLMPHGASAKAMEGTFKSATFSPDGRRLYLTGEVITIEDEQAASEGMGLRVVDVATGVITADALGNAEIGRVIAAPGGENLYVITRETAEDAGTDSWILRRLDGETLAVRAERTATSYQQLLLVPASNM